MINPYFTIGNSLLLSNYLVFQTFGARFFSSLLALCNLYLIYRFVKSQTNHIIAITSAIIVSVSAEYWIIAKSVITDMTLGLYFNAILMSFYIGYIRHKSELKGYKQYYLLAYLASALAILTKGPIGFLLPGLIILIYLGIRRDLKELLSLQILPGLLILQVLVVVGITIYVYHPWKRLYQCLSRCP